MNAWFLLSILTTHPAGAASTEATRLCDLAYYRLIHEVCPKKTSHEDRVRCRKQSDQAKKHCDQTGSAERMMKLGAGSKNVIDRRFEKQAEPPPPPGSSGRVD